MEGAGPTWIGSPLGGAGVFTPPLPSPAAATTCDLPRKSGRNSPIWASIAPRQRCHYANRTKRQRLSRPGANNIDGMARRHGLLRANLSRRAWKVRANKKKLLRRAQTEPKTTPFPQTAIHSAQVSTGAARKLQKNPLAPRSYLSSQVIPP